MANQLAKVTAILLVVAAFAAFLWLAVMGLDYLANGGLEL